MAYTAQFTSAIDPSQITCLQFFDRSNEGYLDFYLGAESEDQRNVDYTGPYTAVIFQDGAQVASIDVTNHFWNTSWWYDITPAAVQNDISDLLPAFVNFPNLFFPTADTYPMAEDGIVSSWSASWLIGNAPDDMLTIAKLVAGWPLWQYENGKVPDLTTSTTYVAQPTGVGVAMYTALEICGVAALATGGPRYLRALQMITVRRIVKRDRLEVTLRDLYFCFIATTIAEQNNDLPADCQPSTVWLKLMGWELGSLPDDLGNNPFLVQVLGLHAMSFPGAWAPQFVKGFGGIVGNVNPDPYTFGALAFAVALDKLILGGALTAAFPNLAALYQQQNDAVLKAVDMLPQCSISTAPIQPPTAGVRLTMTPLVVTMAPGTNYRFTVTPEDASGNPAQLPAGLIWALSDATFGTLTPSTDGSSCLFANNTNKVGSVTVTCTDPNVADNIAAVSAAITVTLPLATQLVLTGSPA